MPKEPPFPPIPVVVSIPAPRPGYPVTIIHGEDEDEQP